MGGWRCGYLRRSREGSDYTTINLYFVSHVFQSTLPRRERRPANGRFRCAPPHFNPRSREGSDSTLCGGNLFLICISIHAPAKGATMPQPVHIPAFRISIHAPAKGATSSSVAIGSGSTNFNPRSREGSDEMHGRLNDGGQSFQSTLPRRERRVGLICCESVSLFQSTLPRRERHLSPRPTTIGGDFNPRSREGSDEDNFETIAEFWISIHAPAKGATSPTSVLLRIR